MHAKLVLAGQRSQAAMKVRVRSADEAQFVLNRLYALGCWRREDGEQLCTGGLIAGVAGYRVNKEGQIFPVLRGEDPGFDSIDALEIGVGRLDRATSMCELESSVSANRRPMPTLDAVIERMGHLPDRNDSASNQLYDLIRIARRLGMIKAVQVIESTRASLNGDEKCRHGERQPRRYTRT
jgi:hypothetical protein